MTQIYTLGFVAKYPEPEFPSVNASFTSVHYIGIPDDVAPTKALIDYVAGELVRVRRKKAGISFETVVTFYIDSFGSINGSFGSFEMFYGEPAEGELVYQGHKIKYGHAQGTS